jgi:hypothetical protein
MPADRLLLGQELHPGACLLSGDGRFRLYLEGNSRGQASLMTKKPAPVVAFGNESTPWATFLD